MRDAICGTLTQLAGAPTIEGPLRLRSSVDEPATEDEIRTAWAGQLVPPAAQELWRAARSAELFRDIDYGQWGLRILDPASSRRRTEIERLRRPSDFADLDVIVGEFLGDLDLLVLDGKGSVRVGLPLDPAATGTSPRITSSSSSPGTVTPMARSSGSTASRDIARR